MKEWSDREKGPSFSLYLEAALLVALQLAAFMAFAVFLLSPQPAEAAAEETTKFCRGAANHDGIGSE